MPEVKKENKVTQPNQIQEAPEATIKRLESELIQVRQVAETAIKENQILRATIKAITQLI